MGGDGSGRKPDILKTLQKQNIPAFMNGDNFIIPNHSGEHKKGTIRETPTQDTDLVNKKYVDDGSDHDSRSLDRGAVLQ